jgi:hypothetical protein
MTPAKFFDCCHIAIRMGVTGFTVTPELYMALQQYLDESNDRIGAVNIERMMTPYLDRPPVCFRGAPFRLDKEFK